MSIEKTYPFSSPSSLSSLSDHSDDESFDFFTDRDKPPSKEEKPRKAEKSREEKPSKDEKPRKSPKKSQKEEDKPQKSPKKPQKEEDKPQKSPKKSQKEERHQKEEKARKEEKPPKEEKPRKSPKKLQKEEPRKEEKPRKEDKPRSSPRSPSMPKTQKVDKKVESSEYPFLDMDYVIANTKGYHDLKIEIRRTSKGTSLFAREPIRKGNNIAFYKLKIIKERSRKPRVKGGIYTFSIYDKEGEKIKALTGDLCDESLEQPRRGIPFFAYFANEPSAGQKCNAHMDDSLKENYKDRDTVDEGDFFTYRLLAMNDIAAGEEICWYYGDHYDRDYEVSDRSR